MGEMVDVDLEHLRLLKICYYILASFGGFFGLFALFYILLGGLFASGILPSNGRPGGDPRLVGLLFLGIGFAFLLISGILAFINFWTGRSLRDQRNRTFCLISAGLSLLNIPFGTAIGIFTFVVLNRPSVRALFEQQTPAV